MAAVWNALTMPHQMRNPEHDVIDLTEEREHDDGVPNRRGLLVTICDLLHTCLKALYAIFPWSLACAALWNLIWIATHDFSSYLHTDICTHTSQCTGLYECGKGLIWGALLNKLNSPTCKLLLYVQTAAAFCSSTYWDEVLVGGIVRLLFERKAPRALRN